MSDDIDYIDIDEDDSFDYESEETTTHIDTSTHQEDYTHLESSSNLSGLDFDNINSAESFLQQYSGSLTIEDVNDCVQSASDFFNMESPMIVSEGWTTGVFNKDLTTVNDDVLIFNPEQLQKLGITEKEGLDLVMTHENTHRALQGLDTGFSEHQEELCCDYMAGVRAGLNEMNIGQMANSFATMPETITHPSGELRIEAIQEGQEYAFNFLSENGHAPTFDECLEHFKTSNAYTQTSDPLTLVPNIGNTTEDFHGFTQDDVEWYEHQARISSGSEQAHWLKEAKWAKDHLHSFASTDIDNNDGINSDSHTHHRGRYGNATGDYIDDSHPVYGTQEDFHGLFVDDRAYHLREAQSSKEYAEWHHKRANEAIERGDLSSARDHNSRAEGYEKSYRDHLDTAKKCTK